jgi:hypothetical protein
MSRRDFLEQLASLTGSVAAAAAILPLLQNDYARAAIVPEGDARRVRFDELHALSTRLMMVNLAGALALLFWEARE